MKEEKLAWNN